MENFAWYFTQEAVSINARPISKLESNILSILPCATTWSCKLVCWCPYLSDYRHPDCTFSHLCSINWWKLHTSPAKERQQTSQNARRNYPHMTFNLFLKRSCQQVLFHELNPHVCYSWRLIQRHLFIAHLICNAYYITHEFVPIWEVFCSQTYFGLILNKTSCVAIFAGYGVNTLGMLIKEPAAISAICILSILKALSDKEWWCSRRRWRHYTLSANHDWSSKPKTYI